MTEKNHHINESADKIVLKTSIKRGSGTRDQDKYSLKIKGSDPKTVAQKMKELQVAMERRELIRDTRNIQPDQNDTSDTNE